MGAGILSVTSLPENDSKEISQRSCGGVEMSEVKTTGNAVYNINYHLVWIPKYRKDILENLGERCRAIFDEIARRRGFDILALEVMADHIHLFVSAPPRYSPAEVVKAFKGASAKQFFEELPQLRSQLWHGHLWAPSYYVGTAGNVSAETIQRYIEETQRR
jgi:putative transposase